ncbi:MAG: hypothetical protein NTZ25_04220 [Candidatus Peregrinibacteria bacterium]|nr:hypothetical protein [Candidatus Peregrinibacteria bacterium]
MKTVLKRLFPRVFGGLNSNDSSAMMEVPVQQTGSNEGKFVKQPSDHALMGDVVTENGHLVTDCKLDGGKAHPQWIRSVAAEKRRAQLGRWYFGN